MAGTGLIIFGLFVALFGYVLIACIRKGRRYGTNRVMAEITDIKELANNEVYQNFFRVIVTYFIDTEPFISTFLVHSPVSYQTGTRIEILFNPNKPSQILSSNENSRVPSVFVGILAFGLIILFIGIALKFLGI